MSQLKIGLGIDDTIPVAASFFQPLTQSPEHWIAVITARRDEAETIALLEELGIRYDELIMASDPARGCAPTAAIGPWKAAHAQNLGLDLFFDDMPEVIHLIQPPTVPFMVCDEVMRSWLGDSLSRT